jgi:hypothetical protein
MAGETTPDIYKNNNIFSKLKRLFSTDVIIRNVGGDNITVLDTNKIQVSGEIETNALHDRYNRLYTTNSNPLYNFNANYPTLRLNLYQDYEMMDTDPIIASTLDIISDESTLKDDLNDVLSIKSSDEDVQKLLYNLFYDVLNIEFNLWSWIRQMCKFGDFFLKLEIAEKFGVFNVIPFSAYNITREEGYDKDKPSSIRFRYDPTGNLGASGYMGGMYSDMVNKDAYYFDNYEMAHFRLLADSNYLPYGRSYIEPARKAYKQMALMEDAMLIHRIVRAPERRIFYINVGSIPPADVEAFMEKTISKMKRTPYVDPQTGEYNLKYNMENLLEDFFIPVRGGDSTTKLDTAPGLAYDGIKDVEYLRDKMMTALKVPKAFFGYDAQLTGKATLAAEDIRFARTIERIQRIVTSELYKIAFIHLYTQGYRGEELSNFELSLTTPSIIYDQEKIALLKEKVDLAKNIMEAKLLPKDWIYDNIFHYSEDQFDEYKDLIIQDAKDEFRLKQIGDEGNDPLESGKSYGTPHDLASLYGKGRYTTNNSVPKGYDKDEPGRPTEKASYVGTQKDPLGKDRIGKSDYKDMGPEDNRFRNRKKGPNPLALEGKYKVLLESMQNNKKINIYDKEKDINFLNENNIL